MMDIFSRIEKIIELEGLTVASFSKKIGIGDQTIRNIVVQKRNEPSLKVIMAIAQSFDWLNLDWLICGSGDILKKEDEQTTPHLPIDSISQTLIQSNEKIANAVVDMANANKILAENNTKLFESNQRLVDEILILAKTQKGVVANVKDVVTKEAHG